MDIERERERVRAIERREPKEMEEIATHSYRGGLINRLI